MLNNVSLVGRLVADPELKQTPNGVSVCSFTLAVRRPKTKEETDFIPCVAWRASAEYLVRYGKKGALLSASGILSIKRYKDQDGNFRTFPEIVADDVNILQRTTEPSEKTEPEPPSVPETTVNDDLPF